MSDIVEDAKAWLESRERRGFTCGRTHHDTCHRGHAECLVARLVAEVERHRMTERERFEVAQAAEQFSLLASANDYYVAQWHRERALALRAFLDRTAPERKEAIE